MPGMAFLNWKTDFELGIPEFDGQHKHLVAIMNRLHDEMKKGAPAHALHAILADLINYTRTHFRDEELAMQQSGYPRLQQHRNEHEELTASVLRFQKDLEEGRIALSIQLLNFLKVWLRDHIQDSDRAYSPHLRSRMKTTAV